MSYCTGCHTDVEEVGTLGLCGPCFVKHEAFLWSCVKSADAGRDNAVAELESLKAVILGHVGENVLSAWSIEAKNNRLVVA